MFRWFRDASIAKKLYFTVGIMALLVGIKLRALLFFLDTLSSLRAYVGGEGLWSKAQEGAIFYLYQYGVSGDHADYLQFERFMAVPAGDGKARRELYRPLRRGRSASALEPSQARRGAALRARAGGGGERPHPPAGAWVLREACRRAQSWRAEGLALAVAVNISPAQLRHPDGLDAVDEALRTSGLDPRLLELEITEGLLVELGGGTPRTHLAGLALRGVRLAIDDFGTGYSSLAYPKRLPVQRIKIDRSFVGGIGSDPEDEAVVQAIVGLGRVRGKTVVAEGVESEAQLAFLRRLRCDAAQGFLLGRPQLEGALADLLLAAA